MTKVERIRVAPVNGPRRTMYIAIEKETDAWLTGKELDREGDWHGTIQIIDKSCLVKRTPVEMNIHYGVFEEV